MRRVSRADGRSFLVGIGVLLAAAVVGFVSFTANQGRLPMSSEHTVRAAFANVGQLGPGDDVRQNSVRVGQVSDVDIVGDQAVVTMDLIENPPVYRDATAALWDQSALGQKFVELKQGTKESGPLGDEVIPSSRTNRAHDLSDVLAVFDPPTRASLAGSLRELGGGAGGHGRDLNDFLKSAPSTLGGVQNIAGALSSERTNLPQLLQTANRFSSRFEGRQEHISSLLRRTDTTLAALNVDDGRPLHDAVDKLPGTLHAAGGALDAMDPPLVDARSAVRDLRPGAGALGEATPDLRGVLREGVRPLDKMPGVAESAEPAAGSLTDTFAAARPVVPRIADALHNAEPPLRTLSPYACDIGQFAFDIDHLFTSHVGFQRQLRIMAGVPAGGTVMGALPEATDPYPAPCSTARLRAPLGAIPDFGGEPR